jgi:hypothetical protein
MEITDDPIFIYSVQYERVDDRKQSIMIYFNSYKRMTKYALNMAWHFANDWPIEFYKCDRSIMKIFSTLRKNEQYIINCLLILRYDQNYNTGILLTIDELTYDRINARVPSELTEFDEACLWNVIIFLNTIADKNNYGFITKKAFRSVYVGDNYMYDNDFGHINDIHDMFDNMK